MIYAYINLCFPPLILVCRPGFIDGYVLGGGGVFINYVKNGNSKSAVGTYVKYNL